MRACYAPEVDLNLSKTLIEGDKIHHLKNVVRVTPGEDILVLNGKGSGRIYQVEEISKKAIAVSSSHEIEDKQPSVVIDLCIGKVKKDALDLIIKQCCEMGIKNIYVCRSEYAQRYPLNNDRIKKLLISGIEQSNNFWLPEVAEVSVEEIPFEQYESIVLATPEKVNSSPKIDKRTLLLIGPEGGFSPKETSQFLKIENIQQIHLEMNILRAPTATTCAVGYLHALLV